MTVLLGAVEAGGTTFRCAVGTSALDLRHVVTIQTRHPDETLSEVVDFFRLHGPIGHLGVATFGPVDIDPYSQRHGDILDTPKLAWQDVPLRRRLVEALGVSAAVQTDVMAAALAECEHGAGRQADCVVYVTVGTGLGAALVVNGAPIPGLIHSETGHMLVPRAFGDEVFESACPFHQHCLEGLASATALNKRWGKAPHEMPADHEAWRIQSTYLAMLCVNLVRIAAPQRILLGGGVMRASGLIERVRREFQRLMAGYHSLSDQQIERVIRSPELEPDAGLTGAMLLAQRSRPA